MKLKAERMQKLWNKYKYAMLIALIGIVLLLWPNGSGTADGSGGSRELSAPSERTTQEMQKEMEEILGRISGVGAVRVMLTVDSDGERQLAQNSEIRYSGGMDAPENYDSTSEIVLRDSGDQEEIVVTRQVYPIYRGALVVCEGGEQPTVQLAVLRAVCALTGLGSDRVTVAKWQ